MWGLVPSNLFLSPKSPQIRFLKISTSHAKPRDRRLRPPRCNAQVAGRISHFITQLSLSVELYSNSSWHALPQTHNNLRRETNSNPPSCVRERKVPAPHTEQKGVELGQWRTQRILQNSLCVKMYRVCELCSCKSSCGKKKIASTFQICTRNPVLDAVEIFVTLNPIWLNLKFWSKFTKAVFCRWKFVAVSSHCAQHFTSNAHVCARTWWWHWSRHPVTLLLQSLRTKPSIQSDK